MALQEDTLSDIAKKAGGFALGAIIGKGGSKFGGLDIKRVYFGYVLCIRVSCWGRRADCRLVVIGCAIIVRFDDQPQTLHSYIYLLVL